MSFRALMAGAAGAALAVSQVLDQNSRALVSVLGPLTTRLEEPLELIAAVLVTTALVMKLTSLRDDRTSELASARGRAE